MTGEFVEHYARISLFYHSERYERNERLAVLLAFQQTGKKGGECVGEKQQYQDRIPAIVAQVNSKALSDRAKLTYMAVYSRRVRFNDTEPDDVTLAKEIGHNVTYIQRGLKELQEKKLIERRLYRDAATKRVKKRVLILRSLNCLQT